MSFSTLNFLFVFLPVSVLFYYISPSIKVKNVVLVILSFVFYAFGDPAALLLLLFCTVVNYIFGRFIGEFYSHERSLLLTIIAIAFNVCILVYYKLMGSFLGISSISIPLGVSFFTFQSIAYIADVFRGKIKAQKRFLNFLLFITCFPQLISGPILRYDDVAHQIETRTHSWNLVFEGIVRFMVGLSKKVIIADYAAGLAANSLGAGMSTPVQAWFGLLMFAFQIYFDFSGYSDMALGLGRMFGFEYPENFRYPYMAASVSQFWRRWHITLGTFFRDYIYIPLGGNRHHLVFNLFVVWIITGLWHGAGGGFVAWGLYNFILIVAEKHIRVKIPRALCHIGTCLLIYFSWSLFYYNNLHDWMNFMRIAFHMNLADITSPLSTTLLINNIPFTLLCFAASAPVLPWLAGRIPVKSRQPLMMIGSFCLLLICTAYLYSQSYVPFIYSNF